MTRAVLGLWLATAAIAAPGQTAETWVRVAAPDGAFSIETPCSAAEIDELKNASAPDDTLNPQSRIFCKKANLIFVVGEHDEKELPAGTATLFEAVSARAASDKDVEGTPTLTTIDGKRAFLNRQIQGDVVAQTGVIEVGRKSVVMIIAGFPPNSGLSVEEQGVLIDRFCRSLKFGRKS